ncbi:heme ABC transporter permease CcmC [Candidatus Bandiella euplotis]|uniref:Heme exporter protein C n=1 Tax=Candidatus Bandiella euplotis TaxID=1664265 RepID=A0ABZ0UJD3_9RICK|nr:heme ABC transporter permease CcmC [Candidatus Bandiella woodruffii]WPX96042.1 Putative heme ABC transporter permease CcmC [Candidatus Bandiella woodruffii]
MLKFFNKHFLKTLVITFGLSSILFAYALYIIFFDSPDDYLQGSLVKILYLHVPSAWLAVAFYFFLGAFSLLFLIFRNPVYDITAKSSAYVSIYLTICTLLTGAIWGKPAWGTWWIWDARLTSMLILFCFELLYFMMRHSFQNELRAAKVSAVLAIFGLLDLPIIKFSVDLWATLHQKSSVLTFNGPKIHASMLFPLSITFLAIFFLAISIIMVIIQSEMVVRKARNASFKGKIF